MKNDLHFMVDIETTSLTPNWAAITSVGVAHYEKTHGVQRTWACRLNIDTFRAQHKQASSANTLAWREQHGVDAMEKELPMADPKAVASFFVTHFDKYPTAFWWAKSPQFDFAFLNDLLRVYTMPKLQFPYRQVLDTRTALMCAKLRMNGADAELADHQAQEEAESKCLTGAAHSAEYDAVFQMAQLVNYLRCADIL